MPATLPRRPYVADSVLDVLAGELLRGEHPVGANLPAERLLSARLGASKLLVRQAIHRLADLGLLEVRQGGATRVLDARATVDLRVLELYYRLAPRERATRELARDVLEKQYTQGLSLVDVFARRASDADRAALVSLADSAPLRELEQRFWRALADAGKNRILMAEVRWWYTALSARPVPPGRRSSAQLRAFYRSLARRLHDRDAPLEYYASTLAPAIDAVFSVGAAAHS